MELLWNLSFFQIAELQEIEDISTSVKTPESTYTFRQANIKMNIMVFKRNVFESRKRPKGVLRPKIKPLLKDIITVRWIILIVSSVFQHIFNDRFKFILNTKWPNILKQFVGNSRRIIWVCLTILWVDA